MKILHIIGSMDPATGGPCQGIRNLNTALESEGVHREVVSMDDPDSPFLGHDPFVIHALGPGTGPWQYGLKLLPWLIKNLSRFDVAIVNGLWLYHEFATIKALHKLRSKQMTFQLEIKIPKLFIMPHGMLDPYFQRAPGRRLKAFRNWVYWKLIESSNIREADGLLFTCNEELRLAKKTFKPYNPKAEYNIGYGVPEPPPDTSAMQDAFLLSCPALRDRPFLLFLSRIHDKKGINLLLAAYKDVYVEKPGADKSGRTTPALLIAGPGLESTYGKAVQRIVADLGLSDFVFFPGMLPGNAKWGAFYRCQAFVLPSHQENFGIAVAEALACAKPVLISNQVNIWREVWDGKGGLVADDTLQGTSELLFGWHNLKNEDRKEMQKNARNCFEQNFSIGPAARRFLNTISSPSMPLNN